VYGLKVKACRHSRGIQHFMVCTHHGDPGCLAAGGGLDSLRPDLPQFITRQ
jgi:hypothetical protein